MTNLRVRDYNCCDFFGANNRADFLKRWGLKNRTPVYESASWLLLP